MQRYFQACIIALAFGLAGCGDFAIGDKPNNAPPSTAPNAGTSPTSTANEGSAQPATSTAPGGTGTSGGNPAAPQ